VANQTASQGIKLAQARHPTIAVINASSDVDDADVKRCVDALNQQVNRDFSGPWGLDATVQAVAKGKNPPAGAWWLLLIDDMDVANALGYHDLTNENLPLGKVGIKTAETYHEDWTVTASHELLEMLADPYLGNSFGPYNDNSWFALEVCDAVEAAEYDINGVKVSDFVYPAWYGSGPGKQMSHLKTVDQPLQLAPGGYQSIWKPSTGWSEIFARKDQDDDQTEFRARPPLGSRRARRRAGRFVIQWDLLGVNGEVEGSEFDDGWQTSTSDGTHSAA
jgi:hypothetical protein